MGTKSGDCRGALHKYIPPRADRDLSKLKPEIAKKVIRAIPTIRESPFQYIKKMKVSNPSHPLYSIRVHRDVRALLSIRDDVLVIHVVNIMKGTG